MEFVGIDCGVRGGIVSLSRCGDLRMLAVMPTKKVGTKKKVDLESLVAIFGKLARGNPFVCIEDTGGHAPSAAGLRSMTYSFSSVETLCVAFKMPYRAVLARKWQSEFWKQPRGGKRDTKKLALISAKKMWSNQKWLENSRCRVAHDGLVDAALIAEYGRRKYER